MSASYADASIDRTHATKPNYAAHRNVVGACRRTKLRGHGNHNDFAGQRQNGGICGLEPSFVGGMVPMYLLMSVFHSAPWLKLIGKRWGHERRISSM